MTSKDGEKEATEGRPDMPRGVRCGLLCNAEHPSGRLRRQILEEPDLCRRLDPPGYGDPFQHLIHAFLESLSPTSRKGFPP